MGSSIIADIAKVAETINEDTCKEFLAMIESIPTENGETKHLEVLFASKRKQLGLSDDEFGSLTFYLLGKLHGGNNVKT